MLEKARYPIATGFRAAVQSLPRVLWAPLASGALLLLAGGVGLLTGLPLIFASLGPTADLIATQPNEPGARLSHVLAGHAAGIAAGILAVLILGASHDPGVIQSGVMTPARMLAAVAAVVLTVLALQAFRLPHLPATATTLLFALGAFPIAWKPVLIAAAGVLLVGSAGEALRRLRLA